MLKQRHADLGLDFQHLSIDADTVALRRRAASRIDRSGGPPRNSQWRDNGWGGSLPEKTPVEPVRPADWHVMQVRVACCLIGNALAFAWHYACFAHGQVSGWGMGAREREILRSGMTLDELNRAGVAEFTAELGAIYEHSPWVAERAAAARPLADVRALHAAMSGVVAAAGKDAQLALVRAHPDLAGRLARAGNLAPSSAAEQAGLGLDRLSDEMFDRFDTMNKAYRARFDFPFVICARRNTRDSVLAAFEARLQHDAEQELQAALAEINAIARFRLDALLG